MVIGGAASGKSAVAERIINNSLKTKNYIATAQAFDDEMRAKIADHINVRGEGWATIEAPFDAAGAVASLPIGQTCLLDCATMWLTNHLLADADLAAETDRLLNALGTCKSDIVIVTNETGQGIVPDNKLARQFREEQGRLNIKLAALADRVVHVVAGIPNVIKGQPL